MTISRPLTIIALTLALTGAAAAQKSPALPQTATATTVSNQEAATAPAIATTSVQPAAGAEDTSEARRIVHEQFNQLLARHPDELTRVVALDPTLLSNETFLARYPELAQFLTAHPEIRQNPHYYLQDHQYEIRPPNPRSVMAEFAETLSIIFVVGLVVSALAWLVRTIIEQKRWSQLSRRQSEVHSKILDRLGSSEELLAYVKSAAGTKYLESAPIALHAAPNKESAPMSRVMWSIQIGVVVAAAGLGFLLVSVRSSGDAEQGFFAMGAIAFCIGAGFITSAFVSMFVSRRLGIGQEDGVSKNGDVADEPGLMR